MLFGAAGVRMDLSLSQRIWELLVAMMGNIIDFLSKHGKVRLG